MTTKNTDVVAEYLHEVDVRLAGLPVLQRRELLADLAAHIAGERAERNIQSEGELIEVLERLGSPDVVAAAAHDEFGPPTASKNRTIRWHWPVAGAVGVLIVLFFCAFAFFAGSSSQESPPAPAVTAQIPQPAGSN